VSQPKPQPVADFTVSLPESWRAKLAQPQPAQPDDPEQRIAVIEDSLRCFTYGWLSCLPVIGVGWLYPAVRRFAHAKRHKAEWNPARGYLAAGLALASVGWMVALVSWLVVLNAVVVVGEFSASDAGVMNLLPAVLFFGSPPAVVGLVVVWVTVCPRLAEFSSLSLWRVVVSSLGISAAIGLTLVAVVARWREEQWERPLWLAMVGLGIWTTWLLGGFIILALRKKTPWVWAAWLIGAAILTFAFALA
jgi:hypothetical protein